jgi:hypothetical protein
LESTISASSPTTERWLFPIDGRLEDVAQLRQHLRTWLVKLEDFDDEHGRHVCLCDQRLDPNVSGVQALEAAKIAVERINGSLQFLCGHSYEPVTLNGEVYQGIPDGTRRPRHYVKITVVGRIAASAPDPVVLVGGMPIPSRLELYLRAEVAEPHFGEAARLAQGGFEQVGRAFETIKQQGNAGQDARRKGYELARQRGWLSADELTNLYESCKLARHGLPAEPMAKGTQLSLDQARLLVRRMLDRWAEELVP